jgi:hypothetical protein
VLDGTPSPFDRKKHYGEGQSFSKDGKAYTVLRWEMDEYGTRVYVVDQSTLDVYVVPEGVAMSDTADATIRIVSRVALVTGVRGVPNAAIVAARAGSTVGIVAKNGTRVTGFTGHGVNRVIGDLAKRAGTKPQAILDALRNPIKKIVSGVDDMGRPFEIFTGQNARVVVNPQTGRVVSVNPLSGAGAHGP